MTYDQFHAIAASEGLLEEMILPVWQGRRTDDVDEDRIRESLRRNRTIYPDFYEVRKEVWSGSFKLFGVDLRCHVLDDGRRVIDKEDVEKFVHAMAQPGAELGQAELAAFVAWQKGGSK